MDVHGPTPKVTGEKEEHAAFQCHIVGPGDVITKDSKFMRLVNTPFLFPLYYCSSAPIVTACSEINVTRVFGLW